MLTVELELLILPVIDTGAGETPVSEATAVSQVKNTGSETGVIVILSPSLAAPCNGVWAGFEIFRLTLEEGVTICPPGAVVEPLEMVPVTVVAVRASTMALAMESLRV